MFEDLVYKYDDTTKEIRDWLGLSKMDHTAQNKYFDPKVSINNTQLWKKNRSYEEEAKQISALLPEFLYDC